MSSNYLAVIDENSKGFFKKKMPNEPDIILESLKPFKADIRGIAVESTYNWYWLVDKLKANGYSVHLANPVAIQKYSGLKHANDKHDAFRNNGVKIKSNNMKRLKEDHVRPLLEDNEDLSMAGRVSKESIDFLSRRIKDIESAIENKVKLIPAKAGGLTS